MTRTYALFIWTVVVCIIVNLLLLGAYTLSSLQEIGFDNKQHKECIDTTVDALREFRNDPNNIHRADIVFDNILFHSPEEDKQRLIERYNKK